MKQQLAAGFIPYEIGDKVKLKEKNAIYIIDDIRMIQYVKSGTAEIDLHLRIDGTTDFIWRKADKVEKIVI